MSIPANLIIRLAEARDLPAILELNRQLNPDDLPLPPDAQLAAVWSQLLDDPIMHLFVAEQDSQVVATCVLAILPNLTRGARPYGLIENVVTETRLRGQGIGRALLEAVLAVAWQHGCYKVMLLTGRPAVVPFYEQVGFHTDAKIGLIAKPPLAEGGMGSDIEVVGVGLQDSEAGPTCFGEGGPLGDDIPEHVGAAEAPRPHQGQ